MKRLTCEMCGSTDLIKQDGFFVCQTCGCKYTVEEAKKMMIEGTVDVQGTVKVDTSDELKNLYQIARRAKDDNNSENAAKYYDLILIKDPTSWEASFYVVYFKAMSCKIAQIRSAGISVSNCLDSVMYLIKNNVKSDKEQLAAVAEVTLKSAVIARMLANSAESHYKGIDVSIRNNYTQECVDNMSAARDMMYNCGKYIETIFPGNKEILKFAAEAWKTGIAIHTQILPYYANKDVNRKIIDGYEERIRKYDPEYYIKKKRESLNKEIASMRVQIRTLTDKKIPSKLKRFITALWIFAITIGMEVFAIDEGWDMEVMMPFVIIGAIVSIILILVALATPTKKKAIRDRDNQIENLKKKIDEKQNELNNLK